MNNIQLALSALFVLIGVAFCESQTAVAWGFSAFGGSTSGVNLNDVKSVSCGGHACVAIKFDGTAVTWGDAYAGGDSSQVDLSDVVTAMCGGWACVALKADNTLVSWGGRRYVYMDEFRHKDILNGVRLTNVASAMCGSIYCIAVKHDGTVAAWGTGEVSGYGLTNVASAMCGDLYCIAVRYDGTVNQFMPHANNSHMMPSIPFLTKVASAVCEMNCVALTHDHTAFTWEGIMSEPSFTLSNVSSSMCGDYACVAIRDDGRVVYWGNHHHYYDFHDVFQMLKISNAVTATCGGFACVVVTADDVAISIGTSVTSKPDGGIEYSDDMFLHEISNVASAMCGTFACVAVKRDGTIATWGASHFGGDTSQVNPTNVVSAMCGEYACVAITTLQAPTEAPTLSAGGSPGVISAGVAFGDPGHTHALPHDDLRMIKELGLVAMFSISCIVARLWFSGQICSDNKTCASEVGPVSLLEHIELSSYDGSLAPGPSQS